MSSAYPQRDVADDLVRRLVRTRESCQRCGRPGTDVAHIVPRRFQATRCDERAVLLLCTECHDLFDGRRPASMDRALLRAQLIEKTIGPSLHREIRQIAYTGPQGPLSAFWVDEVERLRKRCAEEGIET